MCQTERIEDANALGAGAYLIYLRNSEASLSRKKGGKWVGAAALEAGKPVMALALT